MRLFISLLLLALLLPHAPVRSSEASQSVDSGKLESILLEAGQKGFEGVVGVSDHDGTLCLYAFGDAVKGVAPYEESTLVDIASVTKQFTGAAILKLYEKGKLKVGDRLDLFFPGAPADKAGITLHQLLTHTAGLPESIGYDEELISREAFLARAFGTPLRHSPGTVYDYSNVGYSILAAVIEVVSGQPYETYLYENLWQPAGMFSTGYYRPNWSGHTVPQLDEPIKGLYSQKQLLDKAHGDIWHLTGNGGMLSTTEDMLRWHRALLGTGILTADSKTVLMAPHVPEDENGEYHYGYGWSIVPDFGGLKLVWHNGGSYFSRTEFWRLPDSGFGIFIATHTGTVEPYFIADELAKALNAIPPERERD